MSDTEFNGGGAPLPALTTNPVALTANPPGTPVYKAGGDAVKAIATSAAASRCIGMQSRQSSAGERVFVQYGGLLTLSTAQWDALVTGQTGGLTEGAQYYVSDATAGKLKATAPSGGAGHYVAPVCVALSTTTVMILPQATVVSGS